MKDKKYIVNFKTNNTGIEINTIEERDMDDILPEEYEESLYNNGDLDIFDSEDASEF